MQLILDDVRDETPAIRVMTFRGADGSALPDYTAGAHVDFTLSAGVRSYSLINWPGASDASRYVFAVQREEAGDGGSKAMHALHVGDVVEVSAPVNDFELKPGGPVVLLAGGIGVTPLISMATALSAGGRDFAFHYAGRSADVMGFSKAIVAAFPGAQLHFDDVQPLDLGALMGAVSKDAQVYICGPKGMIEAARAAAEAVGISNIHVELFSTPETTVGDTSFEVEIQDTGQVFTIPPGKTIIDVLEEEGVDVMYDCRRGDCGICQTDVISGVPDHRDVVLSEAERDGGKVMQICVSRAKSARLVLDI